MAPTPPAASGRLRYLDWLRGVSVLLMIFAHTFDAWSLPAEKARPVYRFVMVVGGMAAPLFLFLAGTAVALAAASRMRRGLSSRDAARSVEGRGWQVFLYAFLFRLQSFVLGGFAAPANLLKVDILNVMGPAIALTAAAWRLPGTRVRRAAVVSIGTIAIAVLTPIVRAALWPAALPDPIEAYLRPEAGRGSFTLLPWSGFVGAGAVLGIALDGASARMRAWHTHLLLLAAGGLLGAFCYWASLQPAAFAGARFWTTSPSFFGLRVGAMLLLVGVAWLWSARPWRTYRSPVEAMGVGSLFIYWVHVELVYGIAGRPLRGRLTLEQGISGWLGMTALMYLLLLGWNASGEWRTTRRSRAVARNVPVRNGL